MAEADRALERHAHAHHGVISRRQARLHGLSNAAIRGRLKREIWHELHPSVFILNGVDPSWKSLAMAGALSCDGLASHWTAGALWRLFGVSPGWTPHVVVPHGRFVRRSGVRVHDYTQFHLAEPDTIDGIPVTGAAVTIMDLALPLGPDRLLQVIDDARRRELVDWSALLRTYRRRGRRGRNGSANLRLLLDQHFGSTTLPDSGFNRLVGQALVAAGLPAPEYEVWASLPDGARVRYDLAWPTYRLAVELHSSTWHLNRSALNNDARKVAQAARAGVTVLPFTWDQWKASPMTVIDTIAEVLAEVPTAA